MSQNKYIVSNFGFLKEIQLKKDQNRNNYNESNYFDIIWTQKLREAKSFTKKQAESIIKKYNLNCFVWNPFEEERTKEYKVVRRSMYHSIADESEHNVLEWMAVKNDIPKTDIRFLTTLSRLGTSGSEELYDFETATKIANEKNQLILQEITKILKECSIYSIQQ